ncbi:MAG: F0F1 ATP synthase subunit B [Candidatus Marinimicrobia bacterium]|nr:F0F1 ATP synthase subunit B [Candidatus Neomarinimicrobiota bacterium]
MNNPLVQPDPGLFIWTIITFLVLLFLLTKFAWKPLLGMLRKREDTIRQALNDAEKARQELEELQHKSEALIAQARVEARNIVAEGKSAGEQIKADTLTAARQQSDILIKNAEKQIQAETEKAITEIKREVVDLSLEVARKLIRKNLTKDDNQALIDETINTISKRNEA